MYSTTYSAVVLNYAKNFSRISVKRTTPPLYYSSTTTQEPVTEIWVSIAMHQHANLLQVH